jgi:aminoglycoside/choline kinase family phosphotransferase
VPLPIPRVVGHSDPLGIVALDDLGDVTLQAHLATAGHEEQVARYRQAVGYLERLQRRGAELASDRYLPYRLAFDADKLSWELDFFLTHFVRDYRGATLSAAQHAELTEEFGILASDLAAEPRVLCHRDYHSRNLMLFEDRLYLIDFQDARMGPDTYDLASLLRDSYIELEERDIDALLKHFLASKGAGTDPDQFRLRFDVMALQRNLKALGTFGFQAISRHNQGYTQYVPRTLRYVRATLEKYPRFAQLRALLADHIAELR